MSELLPRPIQTPGTVPPIGYSDATLVPKSGRWLALGGHVAFDAERRLLHPGELVPQVARTLENLAATLRAAGGGPEHLVQLTIYTTEVQTYREEVRAIGREWVRVLGKVFPAMALIGVSELFEVGAVVEIAGYAVLPAD